MFWLEESIATGYLKTPRIIEAFRRIDRADFLPADQRISADVNTPLPIGAGQTNSQPLTVAFMIELLDPRPGQRMLDVGSGSGWTTALLAELVGSTGHVWAIERLPVLLNQGKANIERYGFVKTSRVTFAQGDGHQGWATAAPFDRILVSAAAAMLPPALVDQLAPGGRLVIPIGQPTASQDLWLVVKDKAGRPTVERFGGFSFVPLVTDED